MPDFHKHPSLPRARRVAARVATPWAAPAVVAALAVVAACARPGGPAAEPPVTPAPPDTPAAPAAPLAADAVRGVTDPALASLLADHWEWQMSRSPVWATTLGDHRFDDRIPDNSPEAIAVDRATRRQLLTRARGIGRDRLTDSDRITVELLTERLAADVASEVCAFREWNVTTNENPVVGFNTLPDEHKIATRQDADNLLARYRAIGASVDHTIGHLRRGLAAGMVANAESVKRTLDLVDRQLSAPLAGWALMKPAREHYEGWTGLELTSFRSILRDVVHDEVAPAFQRYRDLLRDELLPAARGPDRVGVGALPQGAACYEARIRHFTGLARTADELHALGLSEIARIDDEMRALGKKALRTGDLAAILRRLRTDESLYFGSSGELMAAAGEALAAAKAAIPDYFGILPAADCVVVPIPDYEAPYTTIAYYRHPHYDGSKPGEYFVNTYKPRTRPRFELRVLSFHESIPGHHLQLAIAQELTDLPLARKLGSTTAFVEGWALYTERLADEMGLYPGDLDRMGMLSYDAWRASRLVVDTGIHAKGWTRQQAERFMLEHTALTPINITNEVDRYIGWPGQALAYKVGQLEILRLRRHAEEALGDRFDIKGFHDAVLGAGGVSLPVLAGQVERWIASVSGSVSASGSGAR